MRIVLAIILITACSCASTSDDFCNRAELCNFLTTDVGECVKSIDTALDSLPDSYRENAESELQSCIDLPTCSDFASCVRTLQTAEGRGAQPGASQLLEIE
jgi:hypothetical protein